MTFGICLISAKGDDGIHRSPTGDSAGTIQHFRVIAGGALVQPLAAILPFTLSDRALSGTVAAGAEAEPR